MEKSVLIKRLKNKLKSKEEKLKNYYKKELSYLSIFEKYC